MVYARRRAHRMERRTKLWVRLDRRAVRLCKNFERAGKLGQLSRGVFAELKLTLRAERAHLRRERIVMCDATDASATTHDARVRRRIGRPRVAK